MVNSAESGLGLEQALCWEAAIRQALMPLTPQSSSDHGALERVSSTESLEESQITVRRRAV